MRNTCLHVQRRSFLRVVAGIMGAGTTVGAFAEELAVTPTQTEGPFYPDRLPLDTDNDLLIVNDQITQAVGEITHLTGRVLTPAGSPLRNAIVEIWQADQHGVYLHRASSGRHDRDVNFQGFGRFLTNAKGEYYFRTIKPVPYAGRTPHIHFAVEHDHRRVLTTQCYIRGEPQNDRDGVLAGIRDRKSRELLMADFAPIPHSRIHEFSANFDIVVGVTPEDPHGETADG
ncbi:MAG TPA: protocatechuate 3,4-dioxygenase [Pirellulaceae bacterium]